MKQGSVPHNCIPHARFRGGKPLFRMLQAGFLLLCATGLLSLLLPRYARAAGGTTAPKMTDPPANIECVYHDVSSGGGDIDVRADGRMHIFYSSTGNRCNGRFINVEASGSSKSNPVYLSLNGVNMYRQQSPLAIPDNAYAQVWLNYENGRGYRGSSVLDGGSDSIFSWDYYGYAGLRVAQGAKFALRATDDRCYKESYTLTVHGGVGAAGIGGHQNDNVCGGGSWLDIDVSTNYYKLYVYGGTGGAGIGSGQDGWCDRVYISRGYIIAQGGQGGAGIGAGRDIAFGIGGECNGLTITGGHIEAKGGGNAAGIGGGRDGNANAIWIQGPSTYVKATGVSGGSGVGGGDDGDGQNIRIEGTAAGGPTVYAYSADGAAAIGGGDASAGSNITLRYCRVTASANGSGAGIGGGATTAVDMTAAAQNISLDHANVSATSFGHGAGIGGGYGAIPGYAVNHITIKNSNVYATSRGCGAGIGGGARATASYITIENSRVDAVSNGDGQSYNPVYNGGAGIGCGAALGAMDDTHDITIKNSTVTGNGIGGGGSAPIKRVVANTKSAARDITIEGSTINVQGSYGCAGIGGGASGTGTDITIKNSDITAKGGHGGASGIGAGAPVILFADVNSDNISITDSSVRAFSGPGGGAGIGAGSSGEGTNIVLDGGNIFAEADYKQNPATHGGAVGNGYDANVIFPGLTPEGSVTIHDGTMFFSDLCSRNDDFPGHMEINGGSINIEHIDGAVINSADVPVFKTTATLPGGTADAGRQVTLALDGYTDYNDEAIFADDQGKIYLWLPENDAQTARLFISGYLNAGGGFAYSGAVKPDHTGVLTLTNGLRPTELAVHCDSKVYDGTPVSPQITTNLPDNELAYITYSYARLSETGAFQPIAAAPSETGHYRVIASYPGSITHTSATSTALFSITVDPSGSDFFIACPSKAYDGAPVSPTVTVKPDGYASETEFLFEFRTWDGAQWSGVSTVAPAEIGSYLVQAKTRDGARLSNTVACSIYQDAPVHTVTVTLKKDRLQYTDRSVLLQNTGGATFALADLTNSGSYQNAAVLDGVYTVYVDGASTGRTLTVSGSDADMTLDYFTVTFDPDGGTPAPDKQTLLAGERVREPELPAKSGFAFDGWYNGLVQWRFAADTVSAKLTLTAKWTTSSTNIQVSPASAEFPEKTLDYYAAPDAATFYIVNRGGVPVTGFTVSGTASNSDYLITYTSVPIAAGDKATFTVQPKMGLEIGDHAETIRITAEPASTEEVLITVSFPVVARESRLSVSPPIADFGTVQAGYPTPPAAQTFTITYEGNFYALLNEPTSAYYDVSAPGLMLLSAANPTATFTVRPKASLPEGVHDDTIAITTVFGSAETSFSAQFAVTAGQPAASVTRHPANVTVSVGREASFSIEAAGLPAPDYQWQIDRGAGWETLPDAAASTDARYVIADTSTVASGSRYRCAVRNFTQTQNVAFSDPATLTLTLPVAVTPRNSFIQGLAPQLTVRAGDNPNVTFTDDFLSATLNGTPLTDGVEFDGADGSVLLHFRQDYLNTLPIGRYTLQITLKNGVSAETPIIVAPQSDGLPAGDVPNTGDPFAPLLWLSLLLLSIAGRAAVSFSRKKHW